jgi:hypothetical protein
MDIADLYPNLSADELKEAETNFRRYIEVACEIARKAEQKHANKNCGKEENFPDAASSHI